MQDSQTLTRRLVPALAVTLVATLVLGAVVVTADVATDSAPLLPATFAVAAPHAGDAWRYNVTLHGGWTFGLDDEVKANQTLPFGVYQWGATGAVRGGDGLVHDATAYHADTLVYHPLWIEERYEEDTDVPSSAYNPWVDYSGQLGPSDAPYWDEQVTDDWVRAGGHDVLARGHVDAYNESNTNYGIPFTPGVMAEYQEEYQWAGAIAYPQDESPCLAFNPLQGNNVSLDGAVALFDACSIGGEMLAFPKGLAFVASGIETVSGVEAIRFTGHLNGTYDVWFTPAVPYPVRIAASLPSLRGVGALEEGDRDLPADRSLVLEMVGFQAGPEPLTVVDQPREAAPALAMAPPAVISSEYGDTRIGPDETGITHPFPLTEAFQAALDSQQFTDLKTFLANKPEAYVYYASYTQGTDVHSTQTSAAPGDYSYVWTIGLADGRETFLFTAAKQSYDKVAPISPVDLRGQLDNGTAGAPVYQFERGGMPGYYGPYGPDLPRLDRAPYPARVPADAPTVESLFARWAAFDGSPAEAANAYGFSIGCADDQSDVCDVVVAYFAGQSEMSSQAGGIPYMPFTIPGDPYGTEDRIITERELTLQPDGTALGLFVFDEREYRSSTTNGGHGLSDIVPGNANTADPGYDVDSTEVSGIPSAATKWIPEPKQAAGVGFMGLVIGFLYWIWPKLGMVGLFSRLERGELLDHPARARLVQIVEAEPGIHFHDLAAKAELANGTAVHHLRKLSDSGHINVRRSGRYTCYFPGGRVDPGQAAAAPLLKSDGAKQVLDAIKGRPGMSNLEVAQATGLQPSTVNYHVQRLSQAGLVAALRDGRMVRLHPGVRIGSVGGEPAAGAAA